MVAVHCVGCCFEFRPLAVVVAIRKIPWYVIAAFVLAFLGGGLTVALCAIALLVYISLATLRWWGQKSRG